MSIDPKGCEDVDDAISINRLENGNIEIGVHIADVTHFVRFNSLTDLEARKRATTVYLADRSAVRHFPCGGVLDPTQNFFRIQIRLCRKFLICIQIWSLKHNLEMKKSFTFLQKYTVDTCNGFFVFKRRKFRIADLDSEQYRYFRIRPAVLDHSGCGTSALLYGMLEALSPC